MTRSSKLVRLPAAPAAEAAPPDVADEDVAEPETTDAAAPAAAYAFTAPIAVRQDRTTAALVGFFGLLTATIVAALWLGTFSRQETVRGYVTTASGLTRVVAPRAGVVTRVAVAEGQIIEAGQVILSVEPGQLASDGALMSDVERRGLSRRRDVLVDELERIETFLAAIEEDKAKVDRDARAVLDALDREEAKVREALAAEEDRVAKIGRLVKQGLATRDRVEVYVRAARDLSRQLSDLAVRRTQTHRERTERLAAIDAQINAKTNQRTQFKGELADVEARVDLTRTQNRVDVIAPRGGRVAALPATLGATLTDGQLVAAIADPGADDLVVRLHAPAGAIGLAEPGQRVVLKYDAFPYKSFGIQRGTILSVAAAPSDDPDSFANALPMPGGAAGGSAGAMEAKFAPRQTTFLVTVKPDGATIRAYGVERPIQLGSTLTADIIVERRRLIDWILDPILAMQGRT